MKKILYSSLFLSLLQSILFWHRSPGISIAIFLTATIILLIYNLKEKEMIKNKKGILWAIPIELLGLTYFIFNNTFFKILNVPVILTLFVIMCMNITKTKITENRFLITSICSIVIGIIYGINAIVIPNKIAQFEYSAIITYIFFAIITAMIFLILGIGLIVLKEIYKTAIENKEENDLTI